MEDTDDDDARYPAPANNPNPYSLQFQQLHPQFQHQYPQHQSFLHHNPHPHHDHRQRSKLPLIPALRTHPQQPQNPSQYLSDDDDDDNDDDDDVEEGENANNSAASVSCSSEGTYANAAGAEEEDEGSESIPYAQESTATHLQQQQQQQQNENHGHGHGHSHSHNQFQLLLQQQQQNYLQALQQQQQQQSPMNAAATPLFCAPSTQNPCPNFLEKSSGASSRDDWSEAATWALLESWSHKFLQAGKRSLKMEHWFDISKQVSYVTKNPKSDTHCRNRLDTLKKKYKKEKQKAAETGTCSSWIHFKFLDDLLGSGSSEPATATPTVYLPYGLDAGEFVCSRPGKICLNQGQQFDDEGPGDSPSEEEVDGYDEDDNIHKNRSKRKKIDDESFRSLADSIKRFGEIYERIESSKRQQMLDLERMRKEFDQELKMRKREILEQTQIELAKILQRSDETDPSVTNMSG